MKFFIRVFFLLLFLLNPFIYAEINLSSKNQDIELHNLAYYEDVKGELSFQEIKTKNFSSAKNKVASFGFTSSAYWFKIKINSNEDAKLYKWWLSLSYPLLDKIDLYTCDAQNKLISIRKSGKLRPFSERELNDRNFIFQVNPQKSQNLYIRVKTDSSMQVPMRIMSSEKLFFESQNSWIISGIYYGMFLLIFFYNAISFAYTRTKKYFYYLVFISTFIIYQLSLDGLGMQYFWSNCTWMVEHGSGTMMAMMIFFIIQFSRDFLHTSKHTPTLDKLLILISFVMLVMMIIATFRPYGDVILIIAGVSILLPLLLIYSASIAYKRKFYPARFYLIGWGAFLLGSVLFAMNKFAWIEGYAFLAYSQQLGSALEMVFLSWALADLQKQSENEYLEKLNGLNSLLQEKVDEHLVMLRKNDNVLIEQSRFAAMGEMIEHIAHQWRQPLNVLALINQNFYFKIKLDTVAKDDAIQAHDKINEQLQYMSQTIDDFRNFSNPSKEKGLFCVEDVIQSTINLSDGSLKEAKIKTHLFSDKEHYVFGISQELTQVFMNLIKNTQDAVLDKNTQRPILKFSVREDEKNVFIRVQDNAGGIDADKIAKVFEVYFSTKGKGGSGLGLYMTKEIIQKSMQGSIHVENSKDGALFIISLPKGEM